MGIMTISTWSGDEQPKPQCIPLSYVRRFFEGSIYSASETVADLPVLCFELSALGRASTTLLRRPTTFR